MEIAALEARDILWKVLIFEKIKIFTLNYELNKGQCTKVRLGTMLPILYLPNDTLNFQREACQLINTSQRFVIYSKFLWYNKALFIIEYNLNKKQTFCAVHFLRCQNIFGKYRKNAQKILKTKRHLLNSFHCQLWSQLCRWRMLHRKKCISQNIIE